MAPTIFDHFVPSVSRSLGTGQTSPTPHSTQLVELSRMTPHTSISVHALKTTYKWKFSWYFRFLFTILFLFLCRTCFEDLDSVLVDSPFEGALKAESNVTKISHWSQLNKALATKQFSAKTEYLKASSCLRVLIFLLKVFVKRYN